jgi:para-aminobenzoate synthetase component I
MASGSNTSASGIAVSDMEFEIGFEAFSFQPYIKTMHEPFYTEIIYSEPFALARRLKGERALTLFESAQRHEHLGRYSFLAVNPRHSLIVRDGVAFVDGAQKPEAPFAILQKHLSQHTCKTIAHLPPFQGGWAGYISYDYSRHLEPKARIPAFEPLCPDMEFHLFETVIAIDHLQERAWIIGGSRQDVAELEILLSRPKQPVGAAVKVQFKPSITQAKHEDNVRATVEYILAGDIFQANITQHFEATVPQHFDAFAAYEQLRGKNPSPFAALMDYDELKIISSSPERLIRYNGKIAEARPIKGTRKRDDDAIKDAALISELQTSRKDRAENVMIVDLLRNDLSIVSKPGSVNVPVLCGLETYSNVHHLVSVVQGELQDGVTSVDLVKAVFPGGSITGAPKVRAMEVIAELEAAPRGVYCGSMGYFGFNGTCDFNIGIRTVQVAGGMMRVQGGGGITARSDASAEYEESVLKVQRIMEALS